MEESYVNFFQNRNNLDNKGFTNFIKGGYKYEIDGIIVVFQIFRGFSATKNNKN